MNLKNHIVLRCYIALARGEHFEPSEYEDGMVYEDIESGKPRFVEVCWYEDVKEIERICQARGITKEKLFGLGAVTQPSFVANLLYCSKLREVFGDLREVPGFDSDGNFTRTPGYGMLVPVMKGQWITELKFHPMSKILRPAKVAEASETRERRG